VSKQMSKQAQGAAVSNVDLASRIASAKLALNTALLTGEPTNDLRAFLNELLAEQARVDAAVADQEHAQAALKQIQANRIADDAEALAEARANRLDALLGRFAIKSLA
jgi:hypothetical protein